MQRKLTLRIDAALIAKAKRHAMETGQSVSQIVAAYFTALDTHGADVELSPRVRRLVGALKGSGVTEADYYRYLEEKHR